MLSIKNKVSEMDIDKLKKIKKIIAWTIVPCAIVSSTLVGISLSAELNLMLRLCMFISGILLAAFSFFLGKSVDVICLEFRRREALDKEKKLVETERQVKIKSGYDGFPDVLILRSLLERATTTASKNEETGKVLLRLRLVDDEGKPFSVTLKFENDQIIYDLEIL